MKLIDWYILKKMLGTFIFTIGALLMIAIVFDVSEKIDRFLAKDPPTLELLKYYFYFCINWGVIMAGFFTFLSVILFTSSLAGKSEIIPILCSGVSYSRLTRPYVIGSLLIALGSLLASHIVLPRLAVEGLAFEKAYIWRHPIKTFTKIHLRFDENTYLYFRTFHNGTLSGRQFSLERIEGTVLTEKIMADGIRFDPNKQTWTLENYHKRSYDAAGKESLEHGKSTLLDIALDPKEIYTEKEDVKALDYWQLNEALENERSKGSSLVQIFQIEKYARTSYALANVIMALMAMFISSRKKRGGIGINLSIGLGLIMLYLMTNRFTLTFAQFSAINALLAVWIPNILFTGIAYFLYTKAQR